jgi:autotransporter-like protein
VRFNHWLKSILAISLGSLSADWTPAAVITPSFVEFDVTSVYDPATQTLVAFWEDATNLNFNPTSSISTDHGATWQPSVIISNLGTSGENVFAAYDSTHQTIVAAWDPLSGPFPLSTAVSTDGGNSWGNVQQLAGTNVEVDVIVTADAGRGSVIATWQDGVTSDPIASISTDGGVSWGSPITISGTNTVKDNVQSAYNSATGNIIATWLNKSTGFPFSSTSTDGGATWSAIPTQIASDSGTFDAVSTYNPVFNNIVSTWVDSTTNLPMAAISTNDGQTWSSPITISSSIIASQNVYTAVDPVTGVMFAAWTHGFSPGLPYYSVSTDGGNTWSPAQTISNTVPGGDFIYLTFDPVSRSFLATWTDSISLAPQFSLFALPPLPIPPSPALPQILANQGGNIGRLAAYLNKLASSSPQLLALLTTLSPHDLNSALRAMLPKPSVRISAANTALTLYKTLVHRSQEWAILRHLEKTGQTSLTQFFEPKQNLYASNGSTLFAPMPRGSAQTALHKKDRYAFWAEGIGEFAHQKGQDQLPAFNTTTGGAHVGFDYYCTNAQFSVALNYANSKVESFMEKDEIDFYGLVFQGIGYIKSAFIEAGIWSFYNHYTQNRHVFFPGFHKRAKAHYHGWEYVPHLRVGYDIRCGSRWMFEPFVTGDLAVLFQQGFSEHGASPYNMRQKHQTSQLLQAISGLNTYTWQEKNWGSWIFRITLAYMYKKTFHMGKIPHASIVGEPSGFSVIGYKTAQNLFAPGAELLLRGNNRLFGGLAYEGQFGEKYQSNALFAKIGVFF